MNERSLANLIPNHGKGRPKGSKNKVRFSTIITDEKLQKVIEELYNIALNDAYAKNRIAAITYIIDRLEGRIPQQINQVNTDVKTFGDLLNNRAEDTHDVNNEVSNEEL